MFTQSIVDGLPLMGEATFSNVIWNAVSITNFSSRNKRMSNTDSVAEHSTGRGGHSYRQIDAHI
jgi:hypothetical protein